MTLNHRVTSAPNNPCLNYWPRNFIIRCHSVDFQSLAQGWHTEYGPKFKLASHGNLSFWSRWIDLGVAIWARLDKPKLFPRTFQAGTKRRPLPGFDWSDVVIPWTWKWPRWTSFQGFLTRDWSVEWQIEVGDRTLLADLKSPIHLSPRLKCTSNLFSAMRIHSYKVLSLDQIIYRWDALPRIHETSNTLLYPFWLRPTAELFVFLYLLWHFHSHYHILPQKSSGGEWGQLSPLPF